MLPGEPMFTAVYRKVPEGYVAFGEELNDFLARKIRRDLDVPEPIA